MPCVVSVRVPEARNLPVMDRQSESTDAFIEVRLGKDEDMKRSEVCRRSLNPTWDAAEWFKFELDDDELQDEPLQVRVIDHDKISSHDVIGRVYIALGPLLVADSQSGTRSMDGWFPIYDTLRGARGEVRVMVKLEVLVDANRYRQSSAGVRFCASNTLPPSYCVVRLHGFVEELVVNDDPEYQWIDNIRSKRKSNEERQSLLQKLSCQLQRCVGVKVLQAGANAVLGYRQCIDLEGESGIVLRCIGTIAHLELTASSTPPYDHGAVDRPSTLAYTPPNFEAQQSLALGVSPSADGMRTAYLPLSETPTQPSHISAQVSSSYSEDEMLTHFQGAAPSEMTAQMAARRSSSKPTAMWFRTPTFTKTTEFPFFTVSSLPAGVLVHIGGLVACRSVEFLGLMDNADEPEGRDAWWLKLRREVLSHAHAWGCNAVIGYEERMTVAEEVVVLSAVGTAAVIQVSRDGPNSPFVDASQVSTSFGGMPTSQSHPAVEEKSKSTLQGVSSQCSTVHVPAARPWKGLLPQREQSRCASCNLAAVPSILLCSIDIPAGLAIATPVCLIQARVCRVKKKASGEANAFAVSALLPFIESRLHQQLVCKLQKLKMNAVFGLRIQLSISESHVIAVATGTAVRLLALPVAGDSSNTQAAAGGPPAGEGSDCSSPTPETAQHMQQHTRRPSNSSLEAGIREVVDSRLDRSAMLGEGKGSSFVELDDDGGDDDGSTTALFMENTDMRCSTLQTVPGFQLPSSSIVRPHHLCVVRRCTVDSPLSLPTSLYRCLDTAIQRLCYRAASHRPCSICNVEFDVTQCDDGEDIQVIAKASVFSYGFGEQKVVSILRRDSFSALSATSNSVGVVGVAVGGGGGVAVDGCFATSSPMRAQRQPQRAQRFLYRSTNTSSASGLDAGVRNILISSCDMIPGYQLLHHRAHVCVFLIRESTSLREDHGSLGGLLHAFLIDAQALIRSHVFALGANALLSCHLEVSELEESSNQGQSLIALGGDAVVVGECQEAPRDTAV